LCVNYKRLNDITVNDPMSVPEIDDILAKLGKSNMYSTTDKSKGYYAIQLDGKSQEYSTFCTPTQNYKWKAMPFGLKTGGYYLHSFAQNGFERCTKPWKFHR